MDYGRTLPTEHSETGIETNSYRSVGSEQSLITEAWSREKATPGRVDWLGLSFIQSLA